MLVGGSLAAYGQVEIKNVSGYGQKKFKDAPKKMYLASFRVIYQMLYSQTEVAKGGREIGGGYRGDATAGLNMAIKGLQTTDLQQLTDEIYQNYLAQLKAAGYELVSIDEAQKSDQFEGFERKMGGTLNESQFPGLITAIPSGFEYLIKKTTKKGKEKGRFNGFKVSADMQGTIVSQVTIVVPFVEDAESGFSKALTKGLGGIAKIVVKPNLRLESESMGASGAFSMDVAQTKTSYWFAEKKIKPLAVSNLQLKKDVDIPDIIEEKKYKAAKSSQSDLWGSQYGALTVFNVTDTYLENTYPIEVNSEQYKASVKQAASEYLSKALNYLLTYANK